MSVPPDAAPGGAVELPGTIELPGAFGGHPGPVFALAFSPDSRLLASGGWDGTIQLWSAETGAPIRVLTGHFGSVLALGFAADGAALISVGRDRTIRRWDMTDDSQSVTVTYLDVPHAKFIGAWIGPLGPDFVIAALCADTSLLVFDGDTGVQLTAMAEVSAAAFHPVGGLTVVHYDGVAELWDQRAHMGNLPLTRQHTGVQNVGAAARSPDGSTLALMGEGGVILLGDQTADGWQRSDIHIETPVSRIALDAAWIFVGFTDGEIELYSLGSESQIRVRLNRPAGSPVLAIQIAPNGTRLAAAWEDGHVGIWPLRDYGKGHADLKTVGRPVWCFGHRSEIVSVAHAADGSWLATGDIRGEIRIWETRRGRLETALSSGSAPVDWLGVSPDGELLGAVIDQKLLIWNVGAGFRPQFPLEGLDASCATFAASGSSIHKPR